MIQYFNRLKNCIKNTVSNYKKKKLSIYISINISFTSFLF